MVPLTVARLFVHPVKSLAGVEVPRARLLRTGLANDRRFLIVDENGEFVTQREHPVLATVGLTATDEGVTLRAGGDVFVPWDVHGRRVEVSVWGDRVAGLHAGEAAQTLLSDVLGKRAHLVRFTDDAERPVDARYAKLDDRTMFADGFPVLVLGTASLDDLSQRVGTPVDVRRFRPNLVVHTTTPWDEDDWGTLRVAGVRIRLPKPCSRCVMTTVDPDTAAVGKEPLRTLATFRKRGNDVYVGMNGIPDGEGELAIGDAVTPRVG